MLLLGLLFDLLTLIKRFYVLIIIIIGCWSLLWPLEGIKIFMFLPVTNSRQKLTKYNIYIYIYITCPISVIYICNMRLHVTSSLHKSFSCYFVGGAVLQTPSLSFNQYVEKQTKPLCWPLPHMAALPPGSPVTSNERPAFLEALGDSQSGRLPATLAQLWQNNSPSELASCLALALAT